MSGLDRLEWIIVDNGSTDGTVEFLADWRRHSPGRAATVLFNEGDVGGSRARNQGVAESSADSILFLDNDVYAEGVNWLSILQRALNESDQAVAVAPRLLFPGPERFIQSAGGGMTSHGRFGLLGRGLREYPTHEPVELRVWAPTACLLVRRSPFVDVGGFDEAFDPVSICEDVDLCLRLRANDGRTLIAHTAHLRHYEGTTFNHVAVDKQAHWMRHARVIRRRWATTIARGPFHDDADIYWRPMWKEYDDLGRAVARPATATETPQRDLTFFATSGELGAYPPQVRLGVVGCGAAARRGALPGFSPPGSDRAARAAPFLAFDGAPSARVVGVADHRLEEAETAASEFEARHVFRDGDELLSQVPLDGLIVCTSPDAHVAVALAGLTRGVPVFLEKPGATLRAGLEELRAARATGAPLCMVNLPWMYHPALAALAQTVQSGRLGSISAITGMFEHSGPENWSPTASWQHARGVGGIVRDLCPHVLTAIEVVLGELPAPLVPEHATSRRVAARAVAAGATVAVEVGWDAPVPRFELAVTGTIGTAKVELIPWAREMPKAPAVRGGPYRDFVNCILAGDHALTDLDNVAAALAAVLDLACVLDARGAS